VNLPHDMKDYQATRPRRDIWFAVVALLLWITTMIERVPEELGCVSDTECFIQCERELKRPCTDEDVFGPAEQ